MFWWVQGLGLVTIVSTLLSFIQREKWKMMIYLLVTNLFFIISYVLIGNFLGVWLVVGGMIRTVVYFWYNHTNRKAEPLFVFLFEVYYIVIAILLWSNNPVDILMIINLIMVTYTSWQEDVKILRIGYVFSSLLLIPYDICYGLYTVALSEIVMLSITLFSLVKYAKTTKTSYNVAQKYFIANKEFWGSEVLNKQNYDLILSNQVDQSAFYNFGIIKTCNQDTFEIISEIKKELKRVGLKEVAYIPFDAKVYNEYTSLAYTLQMFFPVVFQDVWMKLIDGFNLNNTRCKIQNVVYKEVDETHVNEIIDLYIRGYHAKSGLDDLNENERRQVEHLKKVDFKDKTENGFRTHAYLAYFNNIPISMVCFLSNGKEGYITKVSTIPSFRRKHVASSLMQYAINEQRKKGVQEIVLVTDKYSTNEKFYAFNSFVEFGQAFAFDVADMSKYKHFLKKNEIID